MHIVIPMSGIGKRFIDGGYNVPKPLIEIDGKPIIQYVVDLFPGETKFTFICNHLHFETTQMKDTLRKIAPDSEIVSIETHVLGPVYTVAQIMENIDDDEEVIVNYCDFGTYWDYEDFLSHTRNRDADGAIISYKGFHPHMLGVTKYATIREENQWMLEIKEKGSFSNDRMQEFVSNGTYYFKKGSYIKKYFKEMMDKGINLNGEYYVSLIYNLMVSDGLKISIYDIQHMLQWGEPYDFGSYRNYSNYFKEIVNTKKRWNKKISSITVLPIIDSKIYKDEGYKLPKPLLPVSGYPMVVQAKTQLPKSKSEIIVCSKEYNDKYDLNIKLKNEDYNASVEVVTEMSNGMLGLINSGIKNVKSDSSLLIGSCDNSILWNPDIYESLIADQSIDAIIWSTKDYPLAVAKPERFNWASVEGNKVKSISIGQPASNDFESEHCLIDVFYFKSTLLFKSAFNEIIENDIQIDAECYMKSLIEILIKQGKRVVVFHVDSYINWGSTPGDYETFNYWQSFFHKFKEHDYDIENDPSVRKESVVELQQKFTSFKQTHI